MCGVLAKYRPEMQRKPEFLVLNQFCQFHEPVCLALLFLNGFHLSSVQFSLSCPTPATSWTAAHQASLSFPIPIFQSLLKFMSSEPVIPSNHLILCRSLLLPPSIFPSIRVFSNELALWPEYLSFSFIRASLVAQRFKCLPPMRETRVRSLGQEDPLEKEMATHSSILAWKIPWTEEPGRLQSTGRKESDTTERLHFHFQYQSL